MSQITSLLRNEQLILSRAELPDELPDFVNIDELVDQACHIHRNPREITAYVQTRLHEIWLVMAKSPKYRCKPFMQWYMEQRLPRRSRVCHIRYDNLGNVTDQLLTKEA
jgi:nitric oxide synthase oxygenase domain/subunit